MEYIPIIFIVVALLAIGVALISAYVMPYKRMPEEAGLKAQDEFRGSGISGSILAIGGPGITRMSLYDTFVVVGYTGILGFLGCYVIPYRQIFSVKRGWLGGVTIDWHDDSAKKVIAFSCFSGSKEADRIIKSHLMR